MEQLRNLNYLVLRKVSKKAVAFDWAVDLSLIVILIGIVNVECPLSQSYASKLGHGSYLL